MTDNSQEQEIREWSNDSYRYPNVNRTRRYLLSILVAVVIMYAMFFLPLPYFIFMPGTAEEIKPMVSVQKGHDVENGKFMLTTVRVSDTNVINYVRALIKPYEELQLKKNVLREGESEQEYSRRQEYVMLTSQSSAMQAAYLKAGVPFHIRTEGVMVLQTLPGLPAEKVLKPGDYLLKADSAQIQTSMDVINAIKGKNIGDMVQITYRRDKEELTETIALAQLPEETTSGIAESPRPGLGIVPADVQSVRADQEDQQVTIKAGEIGGPSAGLMFSLEIYNQLMPGDITKGYRIAGTGTIDTKGNVGVIGGIQHKVIAADREGAEIFFAPKDLTTKEGATINNYSDAVARAQEINSKMKVVEVATLDDALNYLASLPPKQS